MAISNSVSGSNTLKFDDVVGIILREEMRRKSTGETSSNALTVENKQDKRIEERAQGTVGIIGMEDLNLD